MHTATFSTDRVYRYDLIRQVSRAMYPAHIRMTSSGNSRSAPMTGPVMRSCWAGWSVLVGWSGLGWRGLGRGVSD